MSICTSGRRLAALVVIGLFLGVAAAMNGEPSFASLKGTKGSLDPVSVPGPIPALVPQSLDSVAPLKSSGVRKTSKLSSHLDTLYRVDILARSAGRPVTAMTAANLPTDLRAMTEARMMRLDERGRVQVFVDTFTDPDTALPELVALGFELQRTDAGERLLQGWLPIASLEQASKLDMVRFIRPPDYPVLNAGSVTSQGDSILRADEVRQALGVDGSGVRVGVISDGLEGLTASQSSGDLPAVNWTTCNMVPQSPTSAGAGAEGTAMLEIIHDLAPGAELWFGHFGMNFPGWGTSLDFMAAVDCLADHVDVIVDDIAFFNAGPYDGTSVISLNAAQELNDPTNRVRGYYNAVGNFADGHYQEPFLNSGYPVGDPLGDFWTLHRFQATGMTTDGGQGLLCAPGVFCGDSVQIAPGGLLVVWLQWNDPFGASANDYDLLLLDEFDATWYLVSGNPQVGPGSDPVESFAFANTHGVSTFFDIIIGNYRGAAASRVFDMFISCFGCVPIAGNLHNFNTAASSVPNNSDAGGGVVSLGAINASDPGNDTIAFYSSRGPTNDGRLKPDAVAIDGVSVTGAGGFPVPFYGTSAAAPHAGAIAALLLDCDPSLRHGEPGDDPAGDRAALRSALLGGAVDLGAAGADNTYGFGRLDAVAAASLAGCSARPANDDVGQAMEIGTLTFTHALNTAGATLESAEPQPCGALGATVWYRFTVPPSPPGDWTLVVDTLGSEFDTVSAVYLADGASSPPGNLTLLQCNDDHFEQPQRARIDVRVQAGNTYYIQVGGKAGAAGNLNVHADRDTSGDGYRDSEAIALGKDPASYCAIMRADLNHDREVNLADLLHAASRYLQHVPPAPPRADQNGDATINLQDLLIMAGRFLFKVNQCP